MTKCDQCDDVLGDTYYYSEVYILCPKCYEPTKPLEQVTTRDISALTNQIVTQVVASGDWYTPLRELSNLAKNLTAPF